MRTPIDLPAWKALAQHSLDSRDTQMRDLFAKDPNRATALSHRWNDLFLDYSKNRVTSETLHLLRQLLKGAKVEELLDRMFRGEKINLTENRSVLHIALRRPANQPLLVDGTDVMPEVEATRQHMKTFPSRSARVLGKATRVNRSPTW